MDLLNKAMTKKIDRPIKIMQFGEGNFLRGFVDYMVDIANEKNLFDGDIVLVKPISHGSLEAFKAQDCQYTVLLRGIDKGQEQLIKRQVTSVRDVIDPYLEYEKYLEYIKLDSLRFVVSNTTEAGIVYDSEDSFSLNPPTSFPGKVTKLLYERYKHFSGDVTKGLIFLPVELIDDNGIMLKKHVMQLALDWQLGDEFISWMEKACVFGSTLVDRIITGFPADEKEKLWAEWGYKDNLIVTGEPFALWVIETDKDIRAEFPLDQAGVGVLFTNNQTPYKQRKVRILNGAHTSFVPAAFLAGHDFVRESLEDKDVARFMNQVIYQEVIPTLALPEEELKSFAAAVQDRFGNPYIKHALLSISLNSVSKWRARCLPSLLVYQQKFHTLPRNLTFSLAALIAFYQGKRYEGGKLWGDRQGEEYPISDDKAVLEFFWQNRELDSAALVRKFLSQVAFFGQDLTEIPGLLSAVTRDSQKIHELGMKRALATL